MLGKRLAHYTIREKLGRGGMGEIYAAEDEKLGRRVALKILPGLLAENEQLRARFEREARAIASLNHPNIVQIYSVEEVDGVHFFTMELVRGKTLSEIQPRGGFSLSKFLDIAIPLTDAVAAAHDHGITHRDLKPDNVMVSEEGRVKVLDFGLAKSTRLLPASDSSDAPTEQRTQEGSILGTLSYMSPEQAEGKAVDRRSDVFSLGITFYEMLAGEKPFRGDTPVATLSAVIKDDPSPIPSIPRDLSKILKRCLAKDPERRFQSAKDLRNELEELKQEVDSGELTESVVRAKSRKGGLVAAAAFVAALAYLLLRSDEPILRFENPVQITSDIGLEDYPTWSPEGGRLAYFSNQNGNFDIWVSQIRGGNAVNLTADSPADDFFPSWSPDGSQIAFMTYRDESDGGGCHVIPAVGGTPRRVARGSFVWARPSWSADGTRLACGAFDGNAAFIHIVHLPSLESNRVPLDGLYAPVDLSWSPDGRFVAYVDAVNFTAEVNRLWLVRLSGGGAFPLSDGLTSIWSPSFSPDSRSLYFVSNRGGSMDLWWQWLTRDGRPSGKARALTTGLDMRSAAFSADFTKVAYGKGRRVANVWRVPILPDREVVWTDARQITFDQAYIEFLDVSPDGKEILVSSNRGGFLDLWKLPADGGEMFALTSDATPDWNPRWSPDGWQIAFYSYRTGVRQIWVMPSDSGPARQLTNDEGGATNPDWSSDGRRIAFTSYRTGNSDIWDIAADGGEARSLISGPRQDFQPVWSPDDRWIVFISDSRLFRIAAEGGEPEPIAKHDALWLSALPGGNEIVFNGGDNNLWMLSLEDGAERRLTDFAEKRGALTGGGLGTDGEYVYFTWVEDRADIWVMDVVEE
jgi:Tol biopolymer transport system component